MTFLEKQNVGGVDYRVQPIMPVGTCATPAGSAVKVCTFSDNFALVAGATIIVHFTYANTYGDSYRYPQLQVFGTNYPIINPTGTYATNGAWVDGQKVTFTFDGTNFVIDGDLETTRTIITNVNSVAGAALGSGRTIRVMFMADVLGSDTTTGMTLIYNGTSYAVMAGSNGSLRAITAVNVSGTYKYVQAYTTLELMFDGTQFIVIGNPVVVSNSDYTVYADGETEYKTLLNNIDITSDMSFQGYVDSANSNVGLYKYGLLVILNFVLTLNSGTGQTWYYIGDVPSDYLPNLISSGQDVRASVTSQNGYSYSFALNTIGNMYLVSDNNALISGDTVRFQIAYLTAN